MDFSKCQCKNAGWCDLFKKEMTFDPPNWQWCQSLSEDQRASYHNLSLKSSRGKILKSSDSNNKAHIINFYDEIAPITSDYAVCVVAANEYAFDHLIITRHLIKQYAKKCNADYVELTGDQYPDWPMANKYRIHQVATKYKKILYVDCDIIIKENSPNIFEITPDDKLSICSDFELFEKYNDLDWIKEEQEYVIHKMLGGDHKNITCGQFIPTGMLNAGVMVIPRGCADLYIQPKQPYPKIWCFDQHYLSLTIPEEKINLLPDKFNTRTAGISKQKDININQDFWNKVNDAYFIHVNGLNKNKAEIMQRKDLLTRFSKGDYSRLCTNKVYPEATFITNEMLINDTLSLINKLPKIKGVLGIPRSGMIPASILSTVMSVPLYSISDGNISILNNASKAGGSRMSRWVNPSDDLPILVIDDTSFSGAAMINLRSYLKDNYPDAKFLFTTVYHEPSIAQSYFGNDDLLNIINIELKFPHILEWNFFDAHPTQFGMFDLDGVFCPDCSIEIDCDERKYINWMLNVEPFKNRIPKLFHPMAICTGRPEKYRAETEEWLSKHNIKYNKLFMWEGTKAERDRNGRHRENVSEYKCNTWKNYVCDIFINHSSSHQSTPIFFIESCDEQAKMIAKNKNIGTWVISINNRITY